MSDNVNHPSHYATGDVECIDAIKSALGHELFAGYLWGNALKYLWRWPRKGLEEDLDKCEWYMNRLREEGYTVPAVFDAESGCMVPNLLFTPSNCGDCVNEFFAETDKNKRFA